VTESDGATALDLNECAWQLLTIEPDEHRDPQRALELARRACAVERSAGGSELWNYLDTLAHALAANGALQQAMETEHEALALLPAGDPRAKPLEQWLGALEQ
jgi:hypothetical protein